MCSQLERGQFVIFDYIKVALAAKVRLDLDSADQGLPVGARILLKHCKQIDEGGDGGPRGAEEAVADAVGAMLHELMYGLVRKEILGLVAAGIDMADLGQ